MFNTRQLRTLMVVCIEQFRQLAVKMIQQPVYAATWLIGDDCAEPRAVLRYSAADRFTC